MAMSGRNAVVAGASGLIGGLLVQLLADEPGVARVVALVRRPLPSSPAAKVLSCIADLDRPETYREHLRGADVVSCLGTTIKKAGSAEAFRKVDAGYPSALAREASAAGARQFAIVTAVGADARSSVLYNRVKGEVEDTVRALAFPAGVKIFRPSMLLGDRAERRPAERVGQAVMGATAALFAGPLRRYRAIPAADVARAIANALRRAEPGVHVFEGDSLFAMARG